MRKSAFLLVALTALLVATAAEAKNRDGAWELGLKASYIDNDDVTSTTIEELENSGSLGFRVGYHFSAALEAELIGTFQNTETTGSGRDVDVARVALVITGNFLTDRETNTIPYITAGMGVIQEKRAAFTPATGPSVLEAFDSSAILTIGVGARTFFTDNFGVRYDIRYAHHDSFEELQDEFITSVGVTWVLGGQN